MFWMRYTSILSVNNSKQYLIQMNNNDPINPTYIGLFLSNIDDNNYIVYDSHIYEQIMSGGIYHDKIFKNEVVIRETYIQKDIWYNITLTSDKVSTNNTLFLYINGILHNNLNNNNNLFFLNNSGNYFFLFGANALNKEYSSNYGNRWEYDDNFRGNFDDFRYYENLIITQNQITTLIGKVLYVTTTGISAFGNTGIHLEPFIQKIGIGTREPTYDVHIFGNTYIEGHLTIENSLSNLRIDTSTSSNIFTSNINVTGQTNLLGTVLIQERIDTLLINSNNTNYATISNINVINIAKINRIEPIYNNEKQICYYDCYINYIINRTNNHFREIIWWQRQI